MPKYVALLVVFAMAGVCVPRPARAQIVHRSMLIEACTARDQQRLNNCAGYIAGIADMIDSEKQGVCIPKGLNVRLLRQGVSNYLQSHTTNDGPAAPAVVAALRGLYRCIG